MKHFKTDGYLIFGLLLIILSTTLFLFDLETFDDSNGLFTFLFIVHYIIPIVYAAVLKSSFDTGFFSLFGQKIYSGHIILLVLFNIAAFSLNREMVVFHQSAEWLSVFLVFENTLLILLAFIKKTPQWMRSFLMLLIPVFLLFHLHQLLIVLPVSLFGILGGLFLGIGLLLFVPVFYIVALVRILNNLDLKISDLKFILPSLIVSLGIIVHYAVSWDRIDENIQNGYLEVDKPFFESELPLWITAAKQVKDDYLTEAYLKSDLVYQTYENTFSTPNFNSFDETKVHDPIIAICIGSNLKQSTDEKSRIKILKFLFDKRHQTADRFWRGTHLSTDQVVTNVQVFPQERLTYSEMILTIANNERRNRWRPQQEAIYTFQLPNGGVITSLSLWIEGEEEKAILTTKSKAENAYNTIVGRESRDPSVIYWMEGNKARIRVFPCTPNENRKFKVGVTSPMKSEGETLHYEPTTFEGPDFSEARASIHIVTNGAKIDSYLPFTFGNEYISWKGSYQPNWTFSIKKSPILGKSFTFRDEVFVSRKTAKRKKEFDPEFIYLDITNNWTEKEIAKVTFLYSNKKIKILERNSEMGYPNFTLFPYHKISEPEKSIVITKGDINTPNLEDLKDTKFREKLFSYFHTSNPPVMVLDLGEKPASFNKSLSEFGVIHHQEVELSDLIQFVSKNQYPDLSKDPNIIDLESNGISLEKVSESSSPQGSDHLMRLFYYQSIMDQIGKNYFSSEDGAYIEQKLTEKASIANVVTPLSSLIVLESQKDYDRFNIERNKDSLGNATISNQGAVPEPHEWALIIAGLSFLVFLYFKKGLSLF